MIFDEAHQIEDIAGEFFGLHVSTQRLLGLARELARVQTGDPMRAQSLSSRLIGAAGACHSGDFRRQRAQQHLRGARRA